MEDVILHTEGKYRVVAKRDECGSQPECMGPPSLLVGSSYHGGWESFTEHYDGTVDTDAIKRCLTEHGSEGLKRWVRIFAEDLIDLKVAGMDEDEKMTATVTEVNGYSQGDDWLIVEWHDPEHPEYVQGDDHELINWVRGDSWILTLERQVTWTTDDEDYEDREEWEEVESVGGYYVQWPEESEWLKDAAKGMIPED